MPIITPHLWFDKDAIKAAKLYTSIFKNSKIKHTTTIHDTPSGNADIVTLELMGQEFTFINAGPVFKLNPSISFLISFKTKKELNSVWKKLVKDGKTLMDLGEYPFSKLYGWIQDKFGVSWQLMLSTGNGIKQFIIPTLMYVGDVCGKTEEAINFYVSVFHNASVGDILRYSKGEEPEIEGSIKHASFKLENQEFAAMDSALPHDFSFNEAISLLVHCNTQEEIDYYWEKLSADPAAEQCGWLKDKYGISWQIVPTIMDKMLSDNDPEKIARVTEAFLKMKKFDIAELKKAYNGK